MSASCCVGIYVGIWTCQHICQHKNKSLHTHIYIYVAIFLTTSRMCRHLNVLACMSESCCFGIYIYICRHWDLSVYLPAQQQMCWYYVGILITTSRMCRYLKVLACMSASWCVGIYVGIWTCQNICRHTNKCGDIYVSIFPTTRIICRHLNAGIYVRILIFRNKCRHLDMSAYLPAQERICWHMCRHKCQHLDMSTYLFLCWSICWHVQMPTHMPTHQYADIYVNALRCGHILLVVINMLTNLSTHLLLCCPICWHILKMHCKIFQ